MPKVSLNMDQELYERVMSVVDSTPQGSFTSVANQLLDDALMLRERLQKQENLFELANLKTLYYMRELIRTRGEDVLQNFDQKFQDELPTLRALIVENGIDYERI